MTEPTVIGEGSYGCVHNPQLTCDKQKGRKVNQISKLMSTKNATKEMKEYVLIDNADKNKHFYLGKPKKCKVGQTPENIKAIEKCSDGQEYLTELNKYSLLVMEYGGVDLDKYATIVNKWTKTPENVEKIELFWMEMHRILLGLGVFLKNDIIHHDLKPQNIVYDEKNNRSNFIDFGLMGSKQNIMKNMKESNHWLAMFHWSFPLELEFLNKKFFDYFAKKTKDSKDAYYKQIITDINKKNDTNKASSALTSLMSTILNKSETKAVADRTMKHYLTEFYVTLTELIIPNNYDAFMNKSIDTIDLYGTGLAFANVLKNCRHLLDTKFADDLQIMIDSMLTPNVFERNSVDNIILDYELILENNGLLAKYKKHFVNHKYEDGSQVAKDIQNVVASVDSQKVILSPVELSKKTESVARRCPDGKEYNSATRRCVKKCKDGYERNVVFKCRRTKNAGQRKKRSKTHKNK